MEKDWVSVFSTNQDFKAELAKGILEENEIKFVLLNRRDSTYLFGDIEIFVNRDDTIKAKYLLKELDK
ncbi:MAG TPA: DUF2007 domain-containing protein [Bacteroidales bacterium]|nr:DUF2007 domain-containing protein [Bacteroidales bacterium]